MPFDWGLVCIAEGMCLVRKIWLRFTFVYVQRLANLIEQDMIHFRLSYWWCFTYERLPCDLAHLFQHRLIKNPISTAH